MSQYIDIFSLLIPNTWFESLWNLYKKNTCIYKLIIKND